LQHGGQIEHQRYRQEQRDHAGCDADSALPLPKRADPLGDPTAGESEEEQRQRRTERERQRQRHRVRPDGSGGAGDDDGCQHRSCARYVQHAERQTEPESTSAGGEVLLRQTGERSFEEGFDLGEDEAESDGDQRDQRDPPNGVLRQMKQRQQRRTGQGHHTEADDETRDDEERPLRTRLLSRRRRGNAAADFRVVLCARALRTREEDDRQHREDAR
jgi:hypothetical protein